MEFIPRNSLVPVNPDTLEVLRKEYNLDSDRMKQSVDLLEDWVQKQTHFVRKQFRRDYLEKKIIASKGSVEKAKSQIDKLCTLKTLVPKFFTCHNVNKITSSIRDIVCCMPLPKMTKDHQRVYILKLSNETFTPEQLIEFYQLNIIIAEYMLGNDYIDGLILVADFREANLMDILKKMNFIEFQQFVTIIIEGYGARVKGIHLISESKVIDLFIKTVKPLLPPKIANRIRVHQNVDSIYEVIDKELLPVDLGGTLKTLKEIQADINEAICTAEFQEYLEVSVESRTDETMRKIEEYNEKCIGLPGSFRTLTVD